MGDDGGTFGSWARELRVTPHHAPSRAVMIVMTPTQKATRICSIGFKKRSIEESARRRTISNTDIHHCCWC